MIETENRVDLNNNTSKNKNMQVHNPSSCKWSLDGQKINDIHNNQFAPEF